MTDQTNPFSLVRASEYSDQQINSLWVELGAPIINAVIEPKSGTSKYILGSKGTGKTHLLRYHSYQVARLRNREVTGIDAVKRMQYLAVFLRATALDASRFEAMEVESSKWQQLFGVYLELRLAESLLEILCEIKLTSPRSKFNEEAFISIACDTLTDAKAQECKTLDQFRNWLISERKAIDEAVNNAAFDGNLNVRVPFSIGALCLPIKKAMCAWHKAFESIPLIYMLDEVENFSAKQQQVVNSLIRYGEGLATFRVTGRLYARKTLATLGGEENREGSEFTVAPLDEILKANSGYHDFAKSFVLKRLGFHSAVQAKRPHFDPRYRFEEIDSSNFCIDALRQIGINQQNLTFASSFSALLSRDLKVPSQAEADRITKSLIDTLPPVVQKLCILLFCKKYKVGQDPNSLAESLGKDAQRFCSASGAGKGTFATAYSHYKWDLLAQLCRETKKLIPYAGFDTFVSMSCGNPRNLLIILGRVYEISVFRDQDFINGPLLSIELQTTAATEASRFLFERDSNYGSNSDKARIVVERLGAFLRTARYALKIPEVSPLTVSFSDSDLNPNARVALRYALNYSFLFESYKGRPDRNSDKLNRKIQINPMLSPRWGLPTGRRGDINLSPEIVNAIFDIEMANEFKTVLNLVTNRWNSLTAGAQGAEMQERLF